MKNLIVFIAFLLSRVMISQTTATNFNANDCNGTNHELFANLDSGKVVVLIWVMPCSACISGAQTAQMQVQTALVANPGKVLFYLADDFGTTSCQSLTNWCSTNGITDATIFSNNTIKMSDYGSSGMPKIVVLGGTNHKVFYNANAPNISSSGIKNAIDAAILENSVAAGIEQLQTDNTVNLTIYPNPGAENSTLSLDLIHNEKVNIEIRNELGQKVYEIYAGNLNAGHHAFNIKTRDLASGHYLVCFTGKRGSVQKRLIIKN